MRANPAEPEGESRQEQPGLAVSPEALGALASPTLAALYASQGHGEMAAAIYARLDPKRGGPESGPDSRRTAGAPGLLLERLQALRRAARLRRAGGGPSCLPDAGEGTHGS